MREILFRGKRLDTGEWVYGYYICKIDTNVIVTFDENSMLVWNKVDPSTVGQYTGLTDKNGAKIFEGDIIKVKQEKETGDSVVYFENGAFIAVPRHGNIYERTLWDYWYNDWDVEVICNTYDNPDILK